VDLGCVHTDMSFGLQLIEASVIREEYHLYKHITKRVSTVLNEIKSKKCFANKQQYAITSLIILLTAHL